MATFSSESYGGEFYTLYWIGVSTLNFLQCKETARRRLGGENNPAVPIPDNPLS